VSVRLRRISRLESIVAKAKQADDAPLSLVERRRLHRRRAITDDGMELHVYTGIHELADVIT
jgi:hypothetical protein